MGWFRRFRDTLLGARLEQSLDEETRFHLEERTQEYVQRGMTVEDARRHAVRRFGNVALTNERTRDVDTFRGVHDLGQDLQYALRILRQNPGFTAAASLSLALGIGANTAIFSVVDALLMRPLPVERPSELVFLNRTGIEDQNLRFSYPQFQRFRADVPGTRFAAMSSIARVQISAGGAAELGLGQLVSGDWFSLLGVPVPLGRALASADDRTLGGSPVAVLSDGYWARRFGRDPSVVGRVIRLNETPVTVVGVAPSGFSGMVVGTPVDVWLPIMMQHAAHYAVDFSSHNADGSKPWAPQEGIEWLTVVARVPTGTTAAVGLSVDASYRRSLEAQAALIENPDRRARALRQHVAFLAGARGLSPLRDDMSGAVLVLMATVALLLLVACANLANLLVARSAARAQEFAVRRSLGAGRGRLIRQFLTESLTLALLGGGCGLFAARWSGRALLRLASATSNPIPLALPLDWHVFAVALGVSLATGLFFGLAPAWHLSGSGAQTALQSAKRVLGGPARTGVIPLAKTLVVVQVAVSLVLLVGAGVFVRTFRNLLSVESGFERAHVVSARFDPRLAGFTKAQLPALFDRLLDHARAIPGVKSASVALSGPVTGSERLSSMMVPGGPASVAGDSVREEYVGPDYFTTIGTPLLRGRDFGLHDDARAQPVAIVNEAMVRHFFPGGNPIGRQFGYGTDQLFEIVGVARDAKIDGPRDQVPEMAYYPAAQHPDEYLGNLYIRVAGPTDQASGALRRALAEAEPKLAVREVVTLEELNARTISRERLVSNLTGVFGLLAVAVGCLGLYGTVSYSVARRTNEIGIRLALGASCGSVRWLVLRETLLLVVVGSVVGLALVWPGLAAVSSLMYGLSARDPLTIGAAALLLAVVSTVAGAIPAWRASRLDPMTALRLE